MFGLKWAVEDEGCLSGEVLKDGARPLSLHRGNEALRHLVCRALGLHIEGTDGVHLVAEELYPEREFLVDGIDVHNPPTQAHLPSFLHHLDAAVAECNAIPDQLFTVSFFSSVDPDQRGDKGFFGDDGALDPLDGGYYQRGLSLGEEPQGLRPLTYEPPGGDVPVWNAVGGKEQDLLPIPWRGKEVDCIPHGLCLILIRSNNQEGRDFPPEEADEEPHAPTCQACNGEFLTMIPCPLGQVQEFLYPEGVLGIPVPGLTHRAAPGGGCTAVGRDNFHSEADGPCTFPARI